MFKFSVYFSGLKFRLGYKFPLHNLLAEYSFRPQQKYILILKFWSRCKIELKFVGFES